jgi:hypothetical protein
MTDDVLRIDADTAERIRQWRFLPAWTAHARGPGADVGDVGEVDRTTELAIPVL